MIHDQKLLSGTQNHIHAGYFGNFLRFQLRVTTYDGHVSRRRNFKRFFYNLSAFFIGMLRYRAGIDDENIGGISKIDGIKARFLKKPADRRGFRVIEFTPQCIKCNFLVHSQDAKLGFLLYCWIVLL